MVTSVRDRVVYLALVPVTVAAGLSVHFGGEAITPRLRDAAGDALWAVMILWWTGVLVPRAPLRARAVAAFAICAIVETSQAFHTPGLDALRSTTFGHLVLGSGFDPRDFAAYAVGVLAAALAELCVRRWRRRFAVNE